MNTNKTPKVSVIVPFFNHSAWLVEALESVINQSYALWEVIVIDDGSDLHHSEIALQFCSRYPGKIKYTDHEHHINRGVTISRNEGIAKSCGDYIAFLDADDKWLPDKLKDQVKLMEQFPQVQMICEASKFWYSWNDAAAEDFVIPVGMSQNALYHPPDLMKNLYPLGEGAPPCPSSIMITQSAFKRSGGFEPAFSGVYTLYEDQAFLAKIYSNEVVYVSGTANNLYRKREGSMSSAANDVAKYEMVRKFFLRWLTSYLSNQKLMNEKLEFLIQSTYERMTPD